MKWAIVHLLVWLKNHKANGKPLRDLNMNMYRYIVPKLQNHDPKWVMFDPAPENRGLKWVTMDLWHKLKAVFQDREALAQAVSNLTVKGKSPLIQGVTEFSFHGFEFTALEFLVIKSPQFIKRARPYITDEQYFKERQKKDAVKNARDTQSNRELVKTYGLNLSRGQ